MRCEGAGVRSGKRARFRAGSDLWIRSSHEELESYLLLMSYSLICKCFKGFISSAILFSRILSLSSLTPMAV